MPKFRFNKLVRDKIVDSQIASGAFPQQRKLNDEDHKTALVKKIIEESQEILAAEPSEVAGEIADVQQAIDDLVEKYKLNESDIKAAQKSKNAKNGPFKKGIYVEYVELNENNKWTDYYRKHADRYPEIK